MSSLEKTNVLTNSAKQATIRSINPEIRCPACGKLLATGQIQLGSIVIQCRNNKCKAKVQINAHGRFIKPTL